ncbi:MAG: DUF502 domain-containing protein [Planctomycetes bacterium]|nr:DUF502 domain-containing protein [Planctomycetota bacterium]
MLLRSFFRGLLFVVPVAATCYVLWWLFVKIDNLFDTRAWFGFHVPGLGVATTVVGVTLVGLLASNILTRWAVNLMDRVFQRLPLAKVFYSSIRDLMEAFVGERRNLHSPVIVSLGAVGGEALGFITRDDLAWLDRKDSVAVYFPQSYNFAGSVVIFPRDRVTPIRAESRAVMQFIVSGGVSGS